MVVERTVRRARASRPVRRLSHQGITRLRSRSAPGFYPGGEAAQPVLFPYRSTYLRRSIGEEVRGARSQEPWLQALVRTTEGRPEAPQGGLT